MKKLSISHEAYVLGFILVFAVIIALVNPSFFTLENLFDLLKSNSLTGIFAIGMLFVLISGGIDLSFTATATITGYITALLLLNAADKMNIWLIFLIAAVIGTLLGMVNALVIYFFKIPPIITTIAIQNIYYGVLTVLSQGKWLYGFPDWFKKFSETNLFSLPRGDGTSYGFSAIILIWFGLMLIAWFILRFTILGRSLYAMGGSAASAQRAGFDLLKLNIFVYSFMGLMAGIASVIQAMLVQTVAPNSLVGKELDTIAAVILGGASLMGGKGTVFGAMLGVALIAIMSNGITLMHVPASYYKVIIGLVILISVAASAYRQRASARKRVIIESN